MSATRRLLFALFSLAWSQAPGFGQQELPVEKLRPGLVVTHRDGTGLAAGEIVQVEPTIALVLKSGEAAHPRLHPRGTTRWEGYVNVFRPGIYRLSATLDGQVRVRLQGKEVLQAKRLAAEPQGAVVGEEVRLEAGIHPVEAEYTRLGAAARLELFWQFQQQRREPLGYELFFHLPEKHREPLETHRQRERGRSLVEEHGCATCHQPDEGNRLAKGFQSRRGPDLSEIGGRVFPGWLYAWLQAPHKVRPGAVMPQLFADDARGSAERYAVASYLASLSGPLKPSKTPSGKELQNSIARGDRLFHSVGCIACHRLDKPQGAQAVTLLGLDNKTDPDKLATFLLNPLALNPTGRMPHMLLQPDEARDLARFLCQQPGPKLNRELPAAPAKELLRAAFRRSDNRPESLAAFDQLPADRQLLDLGKRVVIDRGCNQCHTLAPGGQPFASVVAQASFEDLHEADRQKRGCLGGTDEAPRFPLEEADRGAIRRFLSEAASGPGTPAPPHAALAALQRFNCLACHTRQGEGGLTPEQIEGLRLHEKAENAEAVTPPPLTGVGHKLRTPWLRHVLTHAGRARTWMSLRMPQFGEANVGQLPEALTALDGTAPDDTIHRVALTPLRVEAGRHLVGKNALGCISCHDLAGNPNTGTRGPDLALMNQRVRFDWYRRWLEQAQRLQPGTRMPTVFPEGKSPLPKVLDGTADAQADAMWAYLSLGMTLPLPEGLEPPKGLVLAVKKQPVLLRTFLPDAGTRAIAVGYPGGVSVAFDAAACRLSYAWTGNFLDASPVWNNRGGAPARILGPRFWTAAAGNPWALTATAEAIDFTLRAKNPSYGAPLPDGRVLDEPSRVAFDGYHTDVRGLPTFRYRIEAHSPHALRVTEQPEPLLSTAGVGVARQFTLEIPGKLTTWFLVGHGAQPPRGLGSDDQPVKLPFKVGPLELPTREWRLLVPQEGNRMLLLSVATAPEETRWYLRQVEGEWHTLLKFPAEAANRHIKVRVHVWSPYRDDPDLLRELK